MKAVLPQVLWYGQNGRQKDNQCCSGIGSNSLNTLRRNAKQDVLINLDYETASASLIRQYNLDPTLERSP